MSAHTGPGRHTRAPESPLHRPDGITIDGVLHTLRWQGLENGKVRWRCACGEAIEIKNPSREDGGETLAFVNHVEQLKTDRRPALPATATWKCTICGERIPVADKSTHLRTRHR